MLPEYPNRARNSIATLFPEPVEMVHGTVTVADGEIDCTVNDTRRIEVAVEDWKEDR